MNKYVYSLLTTGLLFFTFGNNYAQSCDSFRDCDNLGRAAKSNGELSTARSYFQKACFMEAAEPLLNLRDNACRAVTDISGELDNYTSAYSFFNNACNEGKDAGCFHLALLEEDRGNLQLAIQMMKPLCERNYIIHKQVYSSGCTEYKRLKSNWKSRNPRQPRDNLIQVPVLAVTLLLPFIAIIFLILKRNLASLILSGLSFILYGYYEYGVSPYANIRIDLLLIYPVLIIGLVIFITSALKLFNRKRENN